MAIAVGIPVTGNPPHKSGKLKKMVTRRFTKISILPTKTTLAIRRLPSLSPMNHRPGRVFRYIYLQPTLVLTSRSNCVALSSLASIIETSRYTPVTTIAARYRSLDGLGSAAQLFTLPFSFRASPLGEEAPRKTPKAEKHIIIECKHKFREGTHV